jgi:hypothetical protein
MNDSSSRAAVVVGVLLLFALGLWSWRVAPKRADARALVDACVAARREVMARRAARGGPSPPGEPSDAALVSSACAPLYGEATCRDAMLKFDEPPPAERVTRVIDACVRAYCPKLPPPRPGICERQPDDPMERLAAWDALRMAILGREIGHELAQRANAAP